MVIYDLDVIPCAHFRNETGPAARDLPISLFCIGGHQHASPRSVSRTGGSGRLSGRGIEDGPSVNGLPAEMNHHGGICGRPSGGTQIFRDIFSVWCRIQAILVSSHYFRIFSTTEGIGNPGSRNVWKRNDCGPTIASPEKKTSGNRCRKHGPMRTLGRDHLTENRVLCSNIFPRSILIARPRCIVCRVVGMGYRDDCRPGCTDLTEKLHYGPFSLRIRNPDRFVDTDDPGIVDQRTCNGYSFESPRNVIPACGPPSPPALRGHQCAERDQSCPERYPNYSGENDPLKGRRREEQNRILKNETDCCGSSAALPASDTAVRSFPSMVPIPADDRIRPPGICKNVVFPDPDRPVMRMNSPAPQE